MQANTMLCLDMSKCQFDMENFNVIPIIRTNYHSSVEIRVLTPWGGWGGQGGSGKHMHSLTSLTPSWDTSGHKIKFYWHWLDKNSRWQRKTAIWLDNNSKWQMGLWLDKKLRWQRENQPSDWTIIQDGGWACDWTNMRWQMEQDWAE